MTGRHFFLTTAVAAILVSSPATAAGGVAIAGHDRARILPPPGAEIDDYANAGYRLVRRGEEVYVEVDAAPLGTTAPFELRPGGARDPIHRLAWAQTSGASTRYEAISRILGWVARHIEYDLDRQQPQSAIAVLDRRSGYCTGVARLTVALLRAAGIKAREVAGYVVDDGSHKARVDDGSHKARVDDGSHKARVDDGSANGVRGYHRWIEAYLPDRGWVFSDPLTSHHYVPATYVRLASGELAAERGLEGLLLERSGEIRAVDLYPASRPGVRARRNSVDRFAAALYLRVPGARHGQAVLAGTSALHRHDLIDGAATFVGLEPGRYQLRLTLPGVGLVQGPIELPDRLRSGLEVRLAEVDSRKKEN